MGGMGFRALRTAIWAVVGWTFIRLGTAAFVLVAFYAFNGRFSAVLFLPVVFACFVVAVFSLNLTADGLRGLPG